ncbi:MAG: hypothetical protein BA862_08945 [Desulfobulbaceae bacterium S3730MH12]|nr:MAG: hypothetical protein BA862_08945 [Desulfobulbaceae bacterium S3730MH12]
MPADIFRLLKKVWINNRPLKIQKTAADENRFIENDEKKGRKNPQQKNPQRKRSKRMKGQQRKHSARPMM